MKHNHGRFHSVLILAILGLSASSVRAIDTTWIVGFGGDWFSPSNWSDGVAQNGENAYSAFVGGDDIAGAYLSGAPLDRVQGFVSRLGLFETPSFEVSSFGLYSSWTRKSAPSLYRLEAEYPLRG